VARTADVLVVLAGAAVAFSSTQPWWTWNDGYVQRDHEAGFLALITVLVSVGAMITGPLIFRRRVRPIFGALLALIAGAVCAVSFGLSDFSAGNVIQFEPQAPVSLHPDVGIFLAVPAGLVIFASAWLTDMLAWRERRAHETT
jgi:hypothetical protein